MTNYSAEDFSSYDLHELLERWRLAAISFSEDCRPLNDANTIEDALSFADLLELTQRVYAQLLKRIDPPQRDTKTDWVIHSAENATQSIKLRQGVVGEDPNIIIKFARLTYKELLSGRPPDSLLTSFSMATSYIFKQGRENNIPSFTNPVSTPKLITDLYNKIDVRKSEFGLT